MAWTEEDRVRAAQDGISRMAQNEETFHALALNNKLLRDRIERLRTELAAKDAVVEAARELIKTTPIKWNQEHGLIGDVLVEEPPWVRLDIALRALDKPCETCGGSGELKDAVQAWDIPGAPIPDCPDCGGEDG